MANSKKNGADATQVFRQFAWNLAGTLAKTGSAKKPITRRATTKRAAAK